MWDCESKCWSSAHLPIIFSILLFFLFKIMFFHTVVWVFIFFIQFSVGRCIVKKTKCPSAGEIKELPFPSSQKLQTQGQSSEGLHPFVMTAWRFQQDQTLSMQKKTDAKYEFWSLPGCWAGAFQRGARQKVVAGKNNLHRNYIAFLRVMGIRLSQESLQTCKFHWILNVRWWHLKIQLHFLAP